MSAGVIQDANPGTLFFECGVSIARSCGGGQWVQMYKTLYIMYKIMYI